MQAGYSRARNGTLNCDINSTRSYLTVCIQRSVVQWRRESGEKCVTRQILKFRHKKVVHSASPQSL